MPDISAAIRAAGAIAAAIDTEGTSIPPCVVSLAPRVLEADGYVTRQVYAEVPPRVEYSLTERAYSLIPIIDNLIYWAQDHMAAIMNDRQKTR